MKREIAVIFDMDGVICHTNPYHSMAFREFFSKRNLAPTDAEFAEHMFGKSNSYILSHFLRRKVEGRELLEMENEKESLFRELYGPNISPIAGITKFIDDLKENDVKIGVATSAPYANFELILSKVLIGKELGSVLTSEDVEKHKPDPEIYLKSAKNLGIDPENCIVFEDSYSGVSAALNAGMRVVGVLSSHTQEELPPCNMYIENYNEMTFKKVAGLLF